MAEGGSSNESTSLKNFTARGRGVEGRVGGRENLTADNAAENIKMIVVKKISINEILLTNSTEN